MAALSSAVNRLGSGNVRQFVLRTPSSIFRFMSRAPTAGGGDSNKPTSATPSPAHTPDEEDKSTYKLQEYFSYNEYSFYDLENVIDSSGRRQSQPDPKQKYQHTEPWATKETSAA